MEQIELEIDSVSPALRKDGSLVSGMSKKGVEWQLFKVNDKYSLFHYGGGKPEFIVGAIYNFDLETKIDGNYTNYQLFVPKKIEVQRAGEDWHKETPLPSVDTSDIATIISDLNRVLAANEQIKEGIKIINENLIKLIRNEKKGKMEVDPNIPIIEEQ